MNNLQQQLENRIYYVRKESNPSQTNDFLKLFQKLAILTPTPFRFSN